MKKTATVLAISALLGTAALMVPAQGDAWWGGPYGGYPYYGGYYPYSGYGGYYPYYGGGYPYYGGGYYP